VKRTDKILAGGVAALAALLVWVVSGTLATPVVNAGDRAHKFKVVTEDGKTVTPTDFGGKLLVVNFWASWCEPCIVETPSLEAFNQQFAKRGVVVLGISGDTNEKRYKEFLSKYGISFETSRDPDSDIAYSYGTTQFPDSYIIDSSGKVVEKIVNAQNWMDPQFIERIQKLL
jgi:cytochrome c biogenesis protein CcmG, thiol:disulfide interchange protein DsbE